MRQNILIFCHSYETPFVDINNQYIALFDEKKYDVTVAYLYGAPNESVRQHHSTKNVIFLNFPNRAIRGLKIAPIRKMLALQREKNFQIVICHRYKPTYIMLWVARFTKIPALFSVMHELKTMRSIPRKLIVLLLAQKNFVFAGVSNSVRDDLRRDVWGINPQRILTFYNMINVNEVEQSLLDQKTAREQLKLPLTEFIFGNIGRLAIAKNQQALINAFARIKPECPNAKLVIMGKGILEADLQQQIAQLKLQNEVILTGYVEKAFRYIKAFDVFVLSSSKEAFGVVLLEAMVAKVPIIATTVHGIPEVVDEAGILIPPNDVYALAKEMLRLYQSSKEKLSELGEKGYQRALNNFSYSSFKKIFWQSPNLC